uniref:Uncharacterized protein n=1 Tax=Tanacetum cinerariifolium TaxID=118510 RepID=A0A699GFG7_TANCI|nr:hypothetical protein [Tanacetum cinerariifolium]
MAPGPLPGHGPRRRRPGDRGSDCRLARRTHHPRLPGPVERRTGRRPGQDCRQHRARGRRARHPDRPCRPQGQRQQAVGGRRPHSGRRSARLGHHCAVGNCVRRQSAAGTEGHDAGRYRPRESRFRGVGPPRARCRFQVAGAALRPRLPGAKFLQRGRQPARRRIRRRLRRPQPLHAGNLGGRARSVAREPAADGALRRDRIRRPRRTDAGRIDRRHPRHARARPGPAQCQRGLLDPERQYPVGLAIPGADRRARAPRGRLAGGVVVGHRRAGSGQPRGGRRTDGPGDDRPRVPGQSALCVPDGGGVEGRPSDLDLAGAICALAGEVSPRLSVLRALLAVIPACAGNRRWRRGPGRGACRVNRARPARASGPCAVFSPRPARRPARRSSGPGLLPGNDRLQTGPTATRAARPRHPRPGRLTPPSADWKIFASTTCTCSRLTRSASAAARASVCSLSCLLSDFSSEKSFMARLLLRFEVALGIQRGHAAGAGAGDGLAVDMVLHVAGGKHAGSGGGGGHAFGARAGLDVAVVHVQLAFEDARVRLVADGHEQAVHGDLGDGAVVGRLQFQARDAAFVAQYFLQRVVVLDLDLAFGNLGVQAVDQDRFGAELVAAVDQRHFIGNVRQVQRFFHGRVAAADDGHFLVAIEETIARGAGGHAAAHEFLLGRQAQVLGRRAGGNDQGVARVLVAVAQQADRFFGQEGRVDVVEHDLGLEAFGVLQQALHQVRALHAHRVAGPVFHVGGGHQLAALLHARDQHRVQVGAGSVNGGAVAGRAGAEYQNAGVFGSDGHGGLLRRCWINPKWGQLQWRQGRDAYCIHAGNTRL